MMTSAQQPRIVAEPIPDGIADNRHKIRKSGGFVAIEIATAMALVGIVLIWLHGAFFGAVGYLFVNAGIPALAIAGVPAISDTSRIIIAIVASTVLWWTVGYFAAVRASRRPIVDWSEWRKEFQPIAIGVWAGTILALGVAAFVLGAL